MPDDQHTRALWGEAYLLRGSLTAWSGDSRVAITLAEQAIAHIPDEHRYAWIGARMALAGIQHIRG